MDTTVSGEEIEAVEHFQDSAIVRTQFDQSETPASMAVITTLSDVMDTDPAELNSLHSTIDPEALDAIVQGRNGMNGDVHITFTHEGYEIRVHSYGVISIMLSEDELPAVEYDRGAGR